MEYREDSLTPAAGPASEASPSQQTPARDPREVVEYYMAPPLPEVVEEYNSGYVLPKYRKRPLRRRRGKKGFFIFIAAIGILAGMTAACYLLPEEVSGKDPGGSASVTVSELTMDTYPVGGDARLVLHGASGEVLSPQEIYRKVNPSVVTVMVQLSDGMGVGTGVIFTSDGYILTNYHVIEGGSHCTVALDYGLILEAKYVAGDPDNDLAVLKAEAEDLPAAEFGDSDALSVGDPVYAIGNPLGVELRGTLTDGIVSAINRDVVVDGRTLTLIQTNAALNSGNSGGPLINCYGQVVGINTIKMSTNYDTTIEGLGFALPTSVITYMVNDLIQYGEVHPEPSIGIEVQPLAMLLPDGSQGIEVVSVTPGSGAEQAGLVPGDVIVGAEGQTVSTSADLLRIRRGFLSGEEMTLTVWRDGEYLEISVVIGVQS